MNSTAIDLVTPHLLRVVDLAHQAENGVNVDWHVRGALDATLRELGDQYNAPTLVAAYVDGLEAAASRAPKARPAYARVLQEAASMARARARG